MLLTGLAPGRKLCNKAHTNQEHHWTMPAPGIPNHMTAVNAPKTPQKRQPTAKTLTNAYKKWNKARTTRNTA